MPNRKKTKTISYSSLGEIFVDLAQMLRPPERITVSEAAERYRYINQPGAYVGEWKNSTVPELVEPMDTFTSREYSGIVFVGPAQSAKALDIATPIATPDGWTTMGELRVGDTIFNEQGEPCRVTLVTPTMYDHVCYEVEFDDATTIVADAEHRWLVYDEMKERELVLETRDMVDKVKCGTVKPRNRYAIRNAQPLSLPDRTLPIDPYVLGLWLGDGHAYSGQLCIRAEDVQSVVASIEAAGHDVDARDDLDQGSFTLAIDHDPNQDRTTSLRKTLDRMGLLCSTTWRVDKAIPRSYLRSSIEQRRALLQGLNDTDGTITKNGIIQFASSSLALAEGYMELCLSLGIKPRISESVPTYTYKGEVREGKKAYKITWVPSHEDRPFRLQRHIDRINDPARARASYTGRRRITRITRVESVPVCCIQVDSPSHLYLAGRQMVPTHNTDSLCLNTLLYSIKVDPMDMMIVCPTMLDARDFGLRRIDRLHRHSEEIGAMLLPTADADNRFDKQYVSGMLFTLSWPTPSQLAGKPIGRIVLTDRDRMPDNIDGDGEPYDLASKRTTTFGSYAMTVAESSPSKPITNLKWIAQSPHEAPPCEGILKLYNRGDRRRRYWPCPECGNFFEGLFKHLTWDTSVEGSNMDKASTVRMQCPHCAYKIHPDQRNDMRLRGVWLKDGQSIDRDGIVYGPKPRTLIASFWMRGVTAAFASWKTLLTQYLDASDEYERTGSEEALRKFYNNDLGEPYYPKTQADNRLPEVLKARAEKDLLPRHVPIGVRFLVALIDVQKNMFVVQVFGISPGTPFDMVLVDRFDIRKSQRTDDDGERLWIKPNTYVEDWDEITTQVIEREYPLADESGRMMGIRFTGCDSGGQEGVTSKAYEYYRRLREEGKNRRFILIKGDPLPNHPRARINYPDSNRKDTKSGARGDIPVLHLNSNILKDSLDGRLDCLEPGKGMYRFPDWLSDSWFSELCTEYRGDKGWENPPGARNEAWDLSYYCLGLCVSELLRVESINWQEPPGWAAEWDKNDLVRQPESEARFPLGLKSGYNFADFAKALA